MCQTTHTAPLRSVPPQSLGIVYSSVRLLPETVEIEGQLADGRYHRCSVHRTLGRFRLRAGTLGRSRDAKQVGHGMPGILGEKRQVICTPKMGDLAHAFGRGA